MKPNILFNRPAYIMYTNWCDCMRRGIPSTIKFDVIIYLITGVSIIMIVYMYMYIALLYCNLQCSYSHKDFVSLRCNFYNMWHYIVAYK